MPSSLNAPTVLSLVVTVVVSTVTLLFSLTSAISPSGSTRTSLVIVPTLGRAKTLIVISARSALAKVDLAGRAQDRAAMHLDHPARGSAIVAYR